MSGNGAEEDAVSSKSLDDTESPRKRMRLDNSGRKGWSLMDRRADQEVLQEMGVSLLDPDDSDTAFDASAVLQPSKAGVKRRHDQENMNPNVNSVTSPRDRRQSPFKPCSPSPGPSRVKSPRSADKSRALQPCEHLLETTLEAHYLADEETPLGQVTLPAKGVGSARQHPPRTPRTPVSVEEELLPSLSHSPAPGADSFCSLSDEMLLSVFRWLPKRTLAHCMLVCKRWYRVACDETLWQRLDLGNKTLAAGALGRVLQRKPAIVRLAHSEIGAWRPVGPLIRSRLLYLDLSTCTVDVETLNNLLQRCTNLKKLSLESVPVQDSTCSIIGECSQLETLNLSMATGITAAGIERILQGCTSLQSLNVSWCGLCADALSALVLSLPANTQRLNVAGARSLTDHMVSMLVARCPRLLELDLSDCSLLTAVSLAHLLALRRLEHLALSRCYLLPPIQLTKLSCMPCLQYVEVWGMLQAASLQALKSALPAIQLNQFMFSAIARPTVGNRRTSIWGLRTRD